MTVDGVVIGIDTSNYTTSLGIISEDGRLIANLKRPLAVREGERGLRQSDAVFSHVKNIPSLMEEAREYLVDKKILAVGVSTRPRNKEGSYMPCFLSGLAAAKSIALSCGAPVYEFSHQCGHIMAALYSSSATELLKSDFAAFHLSGGTTELLKVRSAGQGFDCEIVGGTLDINAGQVVDRIGVMLGLSFPAGKALEELALSYQGKPASRKIKLSNGYVNLSGLENIASSMLKRGCSRNEIAAFVFDTLGKTIANISADFIEKEGNIPLVFVGGVMSNSIIRRHLVKRGLNCYFAESELSKDNAVGIAALALSAHKK